MKLKTFIRRMSGNYRPNRHAQLDSEISEARESLRLNSIAVESGARAIDRMKSDVLANMTGMLRMVQRADQNNE
ncbi:hypothetical protein FHW77_002847 [Agrobacterium sp. RC10-4-1]|jgi:hypothetical protein|uniref:hypothetical protein n=1 Tax=Agrobacterium sp. RC10-4-1 TaxID=2587039 RepID=UPI0015F99B55|nr:hypothetical protein [Agrobacterium sp. RC10-4-1]MBA8799128.1 hypothetical protein [Agrobacterium sp. RC10-4-1]